MRRSSRTTRPAFSLIELVVVILIITILMSLAIPALGKSRVAARHHRCAANIRSAALMLEVYTASYAGALPFGPRERTPSPIAALTGAQCGGRPNMRHGTWAFLFPDEWSGPNWNPAYRCPGQPKYTPGGGPSMWDGWPTPAYAMTEAVWLDERDLKADGDPDAFWRLRAHQAADVAHPSAKVYLTEFPTFCSDEPNAAADAEIGQTLDQRACMHFFDGSGSRLRVADALPGAGGVQGVLWTADGLLGRDYTMR